MSFFPPFHPINFHLEIPSGNFGHISAAATNDIAIFSTELLSKDKRFRTFKHLFLFSVLKRFFVLSPLHKNNNKERTQNNQIKEHFLHSILKLSKRLFIQSKGTNLLAWTLFPTCELQSMLALEYELFEIEMS